MDTVVKRSAFTTPTGSFELNFCSEAGDGSPDVQLTDALNCDGLPWKSFHLLLLLFLFIRPSAVRAEVVTAFEKELSGALLCGQAEAEETQPLCEI